MTTAIEPNSRTYASPADELRNLTAAVRLQFTWFGVRKTLTPAQRAEAAESFGAAGQFLSAGKKLIDTTHPAFRAVTAVRGRAIAYWRGVTLPYTEPGIRLLRQSKIEEFDQEMEGYRSELTNAVRNLDEHYGELRATASERLGRLYDPADYPPRLDGWFAVQWDYPSLEPPNFLRQLSPRLYQEECQRMTSRFEEAIRLTEQAFTEELAKLVEHLCERLNGPLGERKIFRDSAVEGLQQFFGRFRELSIRSNPELDQLIEEAEQVVRGVKPGDLRTSDGLRERVASNLSKVQSCLDRMLVDQPRRRILRGQATTEPLEE